MAMCTPCRAKEDAMDSIPAGPTREPAPGKAATSPQAQVPPLCWPFPPGSQNHTDKAVKLKPYVPPKRRSLNQY